jgi:ABC-2 type transport system permease protein
MGKRDAFRGIISWRRLKALCHKETLEIFRDPSSIVIAFVLPIVLLFIFGYGINLDSGAIRVGLLLQDDSQEAHRFAASFFGSPYFAVIPAQSREQLEDDLTNGTIRGFVVVAQNFSDLLNHPSQTAPVQVVTDGTEPEIAAFVENYSTGAWSDWLQQRSRALGLRSAPQIEVTPQFWFNPSAESRDYLIPGSITLIMTVIGALLTALVVAREWERGTMETLLASPVTRAEFLLSKLLPYYALGIVSMLACVGVATWIMHVPFRGSLFILILISSLFLLSTLGLGLLISTAIRNQFNAAQAALNLAFLPAMMFSGFIYDISSMPPFLRAVTYLFPARYFVTAITTLVQAGNLPHILIRNSICLLISAVFFIGATAFITPKNLD